MIMVLARMNLKSGKKDSFIKEAKDLISATRLENGCISYDLYSSIEEADVLMMVEIWEDMNCLNSHVETDHFKKFGESSKPWLENEIEIKSYTVGPL